MQDHELRLAEFGIVEGGLEAQRVGVGKAKIGAAADGAVDMHRQAQASGLLRDAMKQEILQLLVIRIRRRCAPAYERAVNPRCIGLRSPLEIQRAQIRSLELERHSALLLPSLQRGDDDARNVFIQSRRLRGDAELT